MTRRLTFAANWKMNLGPAEGRRFVTRFLEGYRPAVDRACWLFPPAVTVEAVADATRGREGISVGVQDIHWEPKGAFTGATSAALAVAAGASLALVGHSERRHVFGETDADTARKLAAAIAAGLTPLLCVGETLDQRERGETESVVRAQLSAAIDGLSRDALAKVGLAYEPVWAIGTGRTATPQDAAAVHRALRAALAAAGHPAPSVLYGGSVNGGNAAALLAQEELDGVLVGGASLDPEAWLGIVATVPGG